MTETGMGNDGMRGRPGLWHRIRQWMAWGLHGAMTCEEFDRGLVDYLDGNLGVLARRQIELHTRLCPHCLRYLKAYDRARRLAGEALQETDEETLRTVPEDLVQAVLSARRDGREAAGDPG